MAELIIDRFLSLRRSAKPMAYLFLDTQSAYSAVIRQLAFGHDRPADLDAAVIRILRHFELSEDCWNELVQLSDQGGVMNAVGVTGHLRAVTADFHNQAFFVSSCSDGARVSETHLGMRPREAVSDLVFTCVYYFVLRKIQQVILMAEQHCLEHIPFDDVKPPW